MKEWPVESAVERLQALTRRIDQEFVELKAS